MFPTGLQQLDEFLSGGIHEGIITDIFGPSSTGKTQLLFQLSSNALKNNNKILYVDTSGNFRPERILELNNLTSDILDKITVLRVTNTHEQIKSLCVINESNFDLILIDNVTELFSYEYWYTEKMFDRNRIFMQYMHDLSLHAIEKKIPIVVTNTVRQINDDIIENMQTAIDPFTHVKIGLSKNETHLLGRAAWLQNIINFSFKIDFDGLTDISEAI